MKFDSFVKVMLVLIVLFLGMIALKPIFETQSASANPGGKYDYVRIWGDDTNYAGAGRGWIFFDAKSGDIWRYDSDSIIGGKKPYYIGKLTELGEPIVRLAKKGY
jgi:hypothetical protein